MKENFKDKINTKGFDKNKQNINRTGANRKLVSSVVKELNEKGVEQVTPVQIVGLFQSLLNLTEPELKTIINDPQQPMLNRIVAKNMLDKKGFEIIERMLDRVHGKAMTTVEQKIETNINVTPIEWVDDENK